MPIPYRCPHCSKETLVPDEYAGKSGPCAGCGQTIAIPEVSGQTRKSSAMAPILIVVIGLVCLVPVVALFVIGAFWVVPVGGARTISLATQSQNNLRQIGLALHGYHDVNSSFPPAYLEDENGRVIASWRVLVLPYLDHRPVFADYDFSASWDAPENAKARTDL